MVDRFSLSLSETGSGLASEAGIAQCFCLMRETCSLVWSVPVLWFRSRATLEAEILLFRHQLNIPRRNLPKMLTLSAMDGPILSGWFGAKYPQGADDREAVDSRPLANRLNKSAFDAWRVQFTPR